MNLAKMEDQENEKLRPLDEYEQIALDTYGIDSHAVKWVQGQKKNKGTLSISHESMLAMLKRMHEKTAVKTEAAELPASGPAVRRPNPTSGMFSKLKKDQKS